jgi:hypothetical protein
MKMQIFAPLKLKFEQPNWVNDIELALIDSILEHRPDLIKIFEADIRKDSKKSVFGRGDVPSVEQIVRAAIYKELNPDCSLRRAKLPIFSGVFFFDVCFVYYGFFLFVWHISKVEFIIN